MRGKSSIQRILGKNNTPIVTGYYAYNIY